MCRIRVASIATHALKRVDPTIIPSLGVHNMLGLVCYQILSRTIASYVRHDVPQKSRFKVPED
jgi:hypothetical protein